MYHDFLEDLRTKYQADKILDGKVRPAPDTLAEERKLFAHADAHVLPQFGAMMDVQLTNDVRLRRTWRTVRGRAGATSCTNDLLLSTQGPVTLILDSATDAPAPPKAKTPLTAEQKERAKAKVAARQDRAKQRTNGSKAPADAAASNDAAVSSGVTALSEDRLISEAEEKSRELAESFKIAMTESYP